MQIGVTARVARTLLGNWGAYVDAPLRFRVSMALVGLG